MDYSNDNVENEDLFDEEHMYDNTGRVRWLLNLENVYEHSRGLLEQNKRLLKEYQGANKELKKEVEKHMGETASLERYSDHLASEWGLAEKGISKALEEVDKLRNENEILRKHAATEGRAIKEIACVEELRACKKELDDLKINTEGDEEEIQNLKAIIAKKIDTIKSLEGEGEGGDQNWIRAEELHKEVELVRLENAILDKKLDKWRRLARGLDKYKILNSKDCRIDNSIEEEVESTIRQIQEAEASEAASRKDFEERVQKGFEDAVNKKLEEIMVDDEELKKERERIKRNTTMSDGTRIVLNIQQEINRRLSADLEEEQAIVKERNQRIEQLQDMLRERDIQILDLKSEASRKEREAGLASPDKTSSDQSIRSI